MTSCQEVRPALQHVYGHVLGLLCLRKGPCALQGGTLSSVVGWVMTRRPYRHCGNESTSNSAVELRPGRSGWPTGVTREAVTAARSQSHGGLGY
jgi:hypothetical protein